MATVLLGNTAPVCTPVGLSVIVNDEREDQVVVPGKTIVVIETPDTDNEGNPVPLDKKLTEVRNAFAVHSAGPAAWVEGHDDFFNQAVAQSFACEVGRHSDWDAAEGAPEAASAPEGVSAVQTVGQVNVEAREA